MLPSGRRRLAIVSARVLRRAAACALPRPSAMASAKLANRTVNHSHAATSPANRFSLGLASLEVLEEQDRGEDAADQHHEHDRVAGLNPGIELAEAVDDRLSHDGGLEQRPLSGLAPSVVGAGGVWVCIVRCS